MVIELEIAMDPVLGLTRRVVFVEVNLLVFEASPEALGKILSMARPFPSMLTWIFLERRRFR